VCKKLIKTSHPFGKKYQKTAGGIFLTHNVCSFVKTLNKATFYMPDVQKKLTLKLNSPAIADVKSKVKSFPEPQGPMGRR